MGILSTGVRSAGRSVAKAATAACIAAVCALGLCATQQAFAETAQQDIDALSAEEIMLMDGNDLPDVLLGVFTNSANDMTDTFYMSADGYHFEQISEAYKDLTPNGPGSNAYGSGSPSNPFPGESTWHPGMMNGNREYNLACFNCPSIIYHNGYFWMLANEMNAGDDGTLRLVISFSKDLVHWSDQRQWKVNVPTLTANQGNGQATRFDAVAADWAVGPDGNIYVSVSLGYYGDFHGQYSKDIMYPYMVKITELSTEQDPALDPRLNWDKYVNFEASACTPINLPIASTNRIDGSWYFEGNNAYYCVKHFGEYCEIWSVGNISNINNASTWKRVQSNMHFGAEAQSMAKLNGKYYHYTDMIATSLGNNGTCVRSSSSITGSWTSPVRIQAYTSALTNKTITNGAQSGPRHGTVITVTDPEAKKVIYARRAAAGWKSDALKAPFTDIAYNAWYSTDGTVTKIVDRGLMGVGVDAFRPNANISRAEVATIIYRAATGDDGNAASVNTVFPDVKSSNWASGNIAWAQKAGIIGGYEDGTFGPDDPVTREQLAKMLAAYVNYARTGDASEAPAASRAKFLTKSDYTKVTEWAIPYVTWCVDNDVMGSNGTINPLGKATRAEAAKMINQSIDAI